MPSGNPYSRAIRGHILVDTSLNVLVMERSYDLHTVHVDGLAVDEVIGDMKYAVEKCDHLLRSMDEQVIDCRDEQMVMEKDKMKQSPTGKL